MALIAQTCRKLAGVAGVNPIIQRVGGDVDARICDLWTQQLVGRVFGDESCIFGFARVAILTHPRGTGRQFLIAHHVDQRAFDNRRVEQVGVLGDRHRRQHTAV